MGHLGFSRSSGFCGSSIIDHLWYMESFPSGKKMVVKGDEIVWV
ncbi:hypothetical protein [Desulfosporosinus fructosivorans]|nr:hypothetical protein [Desulfosporosinus fructosivorans]